MSHLDTALIARSFRDGRAQRTALYSHRRLVTKPLAISLWQLGAEPFSAAAMGFGESARDLRIVVAGDPRNRDLAFAALLQFARWFNPRFETHSSDRETVARGENRYERARKAPQVVVANEATVEMLGRLGRRLAYLPTTGARPAPLEVVRLGQHLLFLGRHASVPGQQLVVALTDLLRRHWATAQAEVERFSLAALDAFIEPPQGVHGFDWAAARERDSVGPVPSGEDDERLEPLVEEFNTLRAGATDPARINSLLPPIEQHYRPLILRGWELMWRCRDREAAIQEAPSVQRRWEEDREAYTAHMDWVVRDGRWRTRQTPRQAAMLLHRLEEAQARLDAEEAVDDPLRRIPLILDHKAVQGTVTRLDRDNYEMGARSTGLPSAGHH
jgi:hypothetical protein